jgi:hypothetical protein
MAYDPLANQKCVNCNGAAKYGRTYSNGAPPDFWCETCAPPDVVNLVGPLPGDCNYHGAAKHDAGKLRYDLIPPHALEALAYVYTIGAEKYGDNNWKKGLDEGRIIGAMFRHLVRYMMGERVDPDDGQHPLASVAWGCFALIEYERLAKKGA